MLFSPALTYAAFAALLSSTLACNGLVRRAEPGHSEFSYNGLTGPVDWFQFNKTCGTGKTQSPINVLHSTKTSSRGDVANYPDIGHRGFEFKNLGHTVELFYKGPTAILGGVEYELQRFHFHTPSEHRLEDNWYPLEVHFVHQAKKDPTKLAVVGIFIELSDENKSDPFMSRLAKLLQNIEDPEDSIVATDVKFAGIRSAITGAKKYTYPGSLTTPPCTEGISWYVSNTLLDINISDYKAFKKVLKYNSRNIQNVPHDQNTVEFAVKNFDKFDVPGKPLPHERRSMRFNA